MSWIKLQPKPDFHALFITADQRFCMRSLGMWRTVSLLHQSSSCIFLLPQHKTQQFSQTELDPHPKTDLRNGWESKKWPCCWLGIGPQMPHTNSVSSGWPGEQPLSLHWREDASPQVLQEESFGVQVVLVPVPASPTVRTVRAWITWNPPGWVGMPWETCGHFAELQCATLHCGSAGGSLWAPSLLAQMHPEIEPCFLPADKCFPQQCYCFLAAISDAW